MRIRYLAYSIFFIEACFFNWSEKAVMRAPAIMRIEPCPISPNITPKKKGKETEVRIEGFASLYVGTPYVSVIC